MRLEDGHPDVPLSDWQGFKEFPPHLIDKVIDRSACRVPNWFVPLARGAAIAGDALLRQVGHRPGMGPPPNWCETIPNHFKWQIDLESYLRVRMCDETNLWTVERFASQRRHANDDEILVHLFGSTPIFTRSSPSAMRIAMYSHNSPPSGLRWIKTSPTNVDAAIEFARKRRSNEALSANSALATGR
jgi:hypothetical protein